jgi:hypothetical protein
MRRQVPKELQSQGKQMERANVPATWLSLILKTWVCVLTLVCIFIPINVSSNMHLHTLYAISHPLLQITVFLFKEQPQYSTIIT